jgi:hypothetical protein
LAIRRSREQCSHSPLSDRSGALTSPLASFCTHEQTCAMPPSSPSDLFWTLLSPLVQQLEALGQVLEVCATYYAWCAGCTAGVAFLLLCGLMLSESAADRGDLLEP